MKRPTKTSLALLVAAAFAATGAAAGTIDPELADVLAKAAPDDEIGVIVQLRERANLRQHRHLERKQRVRKMVREMKNHADRALPALETEVAAIGGRHHKRLWLINGMALKLPAARVPKLARMKNVDVVRYDAPLAAPEAAGGATAPAEWNIDAVTAPQLWSLGHTGSGVVIASMDTGVDGMHPELAAKFRGGNNSWYDPAGEHATPYDAHGHGTQTMGILTGGSLGGNAIGMAPDAQWIAFKQYDDAGQSSFSRIHEGFQWLLDPDGNPDTDDAPHVVNASWGYAGYSGQCITEFNDDIAALKEAGIAVAFSAGNEGPGPGSSISPGNNLGAYSVGAVDDTGTVAYFSSRGPSACDGSIFPTLTAPGVNIYTADLSFGGLPLYAWVDGTSYATPHVAGAMALLAGAFPDATVVQIEDALRESARDLGVAGADNAYGSGHLDVRAAYDLLAAGSGGGEPPPPPPPPPNTAPTAGNDAYQMMQGGTLTIAAPGLLANDSDAEGDALSTQALGAPSSGSLSLNADGGFTYTPAATFKGTAGFSYQAVDAAGLASAPASVSITVLANRRPVALDDAGAAQKRTKNSYTALIVPVLQNDSDPDTTIDAANTINPATLVIVAKPNKGGTASAIRSGADAGTISYKPAKNFTGTETLTYRVKDTRGLVSNTATLTITVQ